MSKMNYNQFTKEDFQRRVHEVFPNITITGEYVNLHTPISYKCEICGVEDICKDPNSIIRGLSGCKCCSGRKCYPSINDVATTHPQYVKFFKNVEDAHNYTYGSGKRAPMVCPICGYEKMGTVKELISKGLCCPKCSDNISYPNRYMYNLLRQLNLDFEREKVFDWSNGRKYDFVLDDYVIEMDGAFHYQESKYHSLEEAQIIDKEKDDMANANGYKMIRIDARKSDFLFIKESILSSELSSTINLDNVDWEELESQLINTNLVTLVAETFNEYKGLLDIHEMGEKLKLSPTNMTKLLAISGRIGLIDYDPNASKKGAYTTKKSKLSNAKRCMCLEDGNIFESCNDADRYYGFSVGDSVARVCRGARESREGLHFVYV